MPRGRRSRVHALLPLLAALAAALLGTPAGLCLGALAWVVGWGARAALALALLGALGGAGPAPAVTWRASDDHAPAGDAGPATAAPRTPLAARAEGRWESLRDGAARLHTARGPLLVDVSADLAPPPAGTPVRVLLRGRGERPPSVVDCAVLGPPSGLFTARLRDAATARLEALLRRPERGLVLALVLGRRHELHPASSADARRTGTAHLLALSGLHVLLLARMLRGGAAGLLLRGRAFEAAGLGAFACLAGGRPPLWRATLGRLMALAGATRGAGPGALHRLAGVALLLAVLRPGWFAELGTQLSFLAVGGLLALSRLLPAGGWQLLAPSGAFLVTAPLAAETFGLVQPAGLLLTPLLVPLLSVLLGLGVVTLLAGLLGPGLDALFAEALAHTASFVLALLELFAAHVPAPLHPAPLPVPALAASLAALAALLVVAALRPERDGLLARES